MMGTSTEKPVGGLRLRLRPQLAVDIHWMLRAAKLPGRTGSVAVALLAEVSASGQPNVTLTPGRLRQIGVSRESGYAAVERMVGAGLVSADRQRGRAVRLTLLDRDGQPLLVSHPA